MPSNPFRIGVDKVIIKTSRILNEGDIVSHEFFGVGKIISIRSDRMGHPLVEFGSNDKGCSTVAVMGSDCKLIHRRDCDNHAKSCQYPCDCITPELVKERLIGF